MSRAASVRPRHPQPTISTRAMGWLSGGRSRRAAPKALAQALVLRHLGAHVVFGQLRPAARTAAGVLRLEHLLDVFELELGLRLGRAGRAPVDLLGAGTRIPLAERQKYADDDYEPEQDEDGELVHAASVRSCTVPDAMIIDALRTPIGRYGGVISSVRPDDLAARVLRAAGKRHENGPGPGDRGYMGCANQAGEDNRNVARMAALLAGLPVEVPAATINRLCGSGLDAVGSAARAVKTGE